MDADTFLSKNKERYEILESLQDQLNHITEDSYSDVIKFIEDHKNFFLNNHENALFFIWNINTFTIYNFKRVEILLDILIHFQEDIKSYVNELEMIDVVDSLLCGLYYLYAKGFFTIKTIVQKSIDKERIFAYFYPEINEYDPDLAELQVNKIRKKRYNNTNLINFLDFVINDTEQHKENRKIYFNPTSLHKSIRDDNIEEFQSILSKNNYDYNYNFKYSFYERTLTENPTPSLIQIAATYGAVHIFKFLWMQNDIQFDDNLICYAISGRNYDIIHICEEKCSRKRALLFSLNSHQHELTDYFIENIEDDENEQKLDGYVPDEENMYDVLSIEQLLFAYQSANYHIILPCLKKLTFCLDNFENNVDDSNYCTFLRKPIFDLEMFKYVYSHKNENVDLFVGYYPIYLQWIYAGMSDGIKSVIFDLVPSEIYRMFDSAVSMNARIANLILDILDDNQNNEKAELVITYFKDRLYTNYLIKCAEYYNEDLIEKLLKSFIEITMKPENFVKKLMSCTSKQFIKSLFKRDLNLGSQKEEIELALKDYE